MTELVVISGKDESDLVREMVRIVSFIDRVPDVSLADVAYTCSLRRGDCVVAIVAEDVVSLRSRLVSASTRIGEAKARRIRDKSGTYYFADHLLGPERGRLAFVYPGVMGFYPDMMRDLAIDYPECRSAFDELEEAFAGDPEFTPSSFIFPPAPYYRHDADIFKSGAYAQALVSTYAGCVAMHRLLVLAGLSPDGVVGFAGGDLAAMVASGAAGETPKRVDRIQVIRDIYRIVSKAVNHGGLAKVAMLTAVLRREGEADELVSQFPSDKVTLAVDFSPRQKTYAVSEDCEREVAEAFARSGIRVMKLALDRPFNTALCESLVPAVRKFADTWIKREVKCDIYSCAIADRVPNGRRAARKDAAERWAHQVRFADTVRKMYEDGYRVFLEVGPRGLMTPAVDDTLRDEEHAAITLNSIHRSGELQFQHGVAQLVALGAQMELSRLYLHRQVRKLDFDAAISMQVRRDSEMKLSWAFPKLTLLSVADIVTTASVLAEPRGRGAKAQARAAAIAEKERRRQQFGFGGTKPMISDYVELNSSPGVSIEITKSLIRSELTFISDYALGTSQLSYSDPNLKGLVIFPVSVGIELMAEVAELVMPSQVVVRVDDLTYRRMIYLERDNVKIFARAERISSGSARESAIKVQIRDDSPNSAYTWPVMEATVVMAASVPESRPVSVDALSRPRSVHWSGREIYPARLCVGKRLRGIRFVDAWSESGIDFQVEVPQLSGNVSFSRFPAWVVNPILLETITSGFSLWRSHERFAGAFSFPFRMRRLTLSGAIPEEGATLKCYLRLTGVTPSSHVCNVVATDGNGKELMSVSGWEELTERVPVEYRSLILQPATSYLTESLGRPILGEPATDVASAFVVDVPYQLFEHNEELWLKTLSHVVLDASECSDFENMTGSNSRRTEWLFGRAAAKEAVRRYLNEFHQARWSDADVRIWADDSGKPHALGAWNDYLNTKLDIAIAHTARFIVAVAAANARVGVDVESVARNFSDEFAAGVFTPEELELAAQAANASQALIRFWCAKEAVSKALGTGIRYSPREMVVTGFLADTGSITVRLVGAWAEAFKMFRGRDIAVTVKTMRDHALASCFIPAALFD